MFGNSGHINTGRNLPAATAVSISLTLVLFLTLKFDRWAFAAFAAVWAFLGVRELVSMLHARGSQLPESVLLIAAPLIVLTAYSRGVQDAAVCLTFAAVIGFFVRLKNGSTNYLSDISFSTLSLIYVPFLLSFAVAMSHSENGLARVLVLMLLTSGNDTGGYFAGILFGKHQMSPVLSPKKTWEGFAGSFVLQVLLGVFAVPLLLDVSWWQGALLAILLTFTGTGGDLIESAIKRDVGVKDMGHILPGHGGIMDRLDSVLINAPVAWFVLTVIFGV